MNQALRNGYGCDESGGGEESRMPRGWGWGRSVVQWNRGCVGSEKRGTVDKE